MHILKQQTRGGFETRPYKESCNDLGSTGNCETVSSWRSLGGASILPVAGRRAHDV